MWSNLALLFALTLFPFATGWMGETHLARVPTVTYGIVLLAAALAYFVLQGRIVAQHGGPSSVLGEVLGKDWKGKLSLGIYLVAIGATWVSTFISATCYVVVALVWLVPDRRLERVVLDLEQAPQA